MSEFRLFHEITTRSRSKAWEEASLEWNLTTVYESKKQKSCLCGHFPIIEICVLKNKFNQNTVRVGNCCVKKFLQLPSHKIFNAFKRIREDISKSLNIESLDYAFQQKWLNDWEISFYKDIFRKRNLTEKQSIKKSLINRLLVKRFYYQS